MMMMKEKGEEEEESMKKESVLLNMEGFPTPLTQSSISSSRSSSSSSRYKFYVLGAILILACWTIVTGTVTLKWSAPNLMLLSEGLITSSPIHDEMDILELEEREKVVRQMWDVYTHNRRIKLPRFWQDAFVAAYEDLVHDSPAVKDAAITEIAKMSVRTLRFDSPPSLSSSASSSSKTGRKSRKQKRKGNP